MDNSRSHIVILVGRSGSGKGTQGEFIKKFLQDKFKNQKTYYISTGERFRNFTQKNTLSSRLALSINKRGGLQPEFLAVWNWASILIDEISEPGNIIFDGAPRKLHEAEVLDSAISFYDWQKPLVIEIDVSNEECLRRLLLRKRGDDNEEGIKERLSWYDRDVVPMLAWYKNNSRYNFLSVNGNRTIDEIQKDIHAYLENYLS